MKKLIYCALALAAGLFATSCQQENLEPVQSGTTVTYTVNVPEVATKAIGDGNNIKQLIYAVYRVTGETEEVAKTTLQDSELMYQKAVLVQGGSTVIPLELMNDQSYLILFWAQVENKWFDVNYKFGTAGVKYPNTYVPNSDDYAAFSNVDYISVDGSAKKSITLTRPFGQLNIATNLPNPDFFTPNITGTSVTVTGAASVYDVATGKGTAGDLQFESVLPITSETFPNYDAYLSMNYVFVPDQQATVGVSYVITTEAHGNVENTITNVPIKKNYKTNIVGKLLTSETDYTVTLDKVWGDEGKNMEVITEGVVKNINGDYEITTAVGFAYAINELFADGGTFYIHPGTYNFTGLVVEPQPTKPGAILNVKANEVPVVTRSTPGFEIIGLNTPLVSEVTTGSQALFSGLVLPEDNKLVGVNNGVVGVANCSNAEQETGEALIDNNTNGKVVNTVSMATVAEIKAAMEQGLKLIELTGDVTTADQFTIGTSVIIDGNGYTWTYTGSDRAITAENTVSNIDVIIKNFNLELSASYCQRGINFNVPDGTLTIKNVKVSANEEYTPATYAINLPSSSDNSIVTINNSYLRGNIALNVWGENMTINATNTEFVSYDANEVENYCAISLNNDGSNIANGTTVNITDGKIIALDENGEPSYAVRNSTMTGEVVVSETTEVAGVVANPVALVVYEGYNEFYSFTTLQEAIDKVCKDNNGSVRLIKDIEVSETVVVPADETVVIDLNGKTLTGTMPKSVGHVLKNEGTLTLKNGTISSTGANGGSAIYNTGTLVVENVFINGAPQEGSGWPSYAVNNYGPATFTETTITSNHGAVASYADATINNCNITLNGFGGSSHVFYFGEGADVVVNGGVYTHKGNVDGSLGYIMTGATITINDGTFSASNGGYGLAAYNGSITVNGGYFTNQFQAWGGPISVTGGTFTANPTNYLAEGYKAVEISKGVYKVLSGDANYCGSVITNQDGVRYEGEVFETGYMENALWFNNYVFGGEAAIKVTDKTYGAIIIENCSGNFQNDVITIDNTNNSVMILQNLDFTLAEGKKLIKSVNKIYQVFMENITINGVKQTQESIAAYLENVEWYQVVEEI